MPLAEKLTWVMSWGSFVRLVDTWSPDLLQRVRQGEVLESEGWTCWVGDRGEVHVEKEG